MRHVAVFDLAERNIDPDISAVVLTAYELRRASMQLGSLSSRDDLTLHLLVSAAAGDIQPVPIVEALLHVESLFQRYSDWPAVAHLLDVAASIFQAEDDLIESSAAATSAKSTFYDMDRLWELAIHESFRSAATGTVLAATLHPLRGQLGACSPMEAPNSIRMWCCLMMSTLG